MKKQEDDASWERAVSEPRLAITGIHARGIGTRRLQLIVRPSFDEGRAWEVRQLGDEWSAFRSEIFSDWPEFKLVGYDKLPVASSNLQSLFARVVALSFPMSPHVNGMGGLDGDVCQMAVFGDMYSEWRFQWWSTYPAQWRPLVDIATEMVNVFSNAVRSRR